MTIQRDVNLSYEDARFDIQFEDGDLMLGDSVPTALSVALFTDARITVDEAETGQDLRGWNILPIGSKLWNKLRGKRGEALLREVEQNVYEATRELIQRQVITNITATASFSNSPSNAIILRVEVVKPDDERLVFRSNLGALV